MTSSDLYFKKITLPGLNLRGQGQQLASTWMARRQEVANLREEEGESYEEAGEKVIKCHTDRDK